MVPILGNQGGPITGNPALVYPGGRDGVPDPLFGMTSADMLEHHSKLFRAGYWAGVKEGPPRDLDTKWQLG